MAKQLFVILRVPGGSESSRQSSGYLRAGDWTDRFKFGPLRLDDTLLVNRRIAKYFVKELSFKPVNARKSTWTYEIVPVFLTTY